MTGVAGCSRAEIDYTAYVADEWVLVVAGCSRAEIDYTLVRGHPVRVIVAGCSRAEIDYTAPPPEPPGLPLRAALGPRSITLRRQSRCGGSWLRAALGPRSITLGHERVVYEPTVAGCSRAEIDYTLRSAWSVVRRVAGCSRAEIDYTIKAGCDDEYRLRAALGPRSITLRYGVRPRWVLLRAALGPRSITLAGGGGF